MSQCKLTGSFNDRDPVSAWCTWVNLAASGIQGQSHSYQICQSPLDPAVKPRDDNVWQRIDKNDVNPAKAGIQSRSHSLQKCQSPLDPVVEPLDDSNLSGFLLEPGRYPAGGGC